MGMLISGYNPAVRVRTHEERVKAMRDAEAAQRKAYGIINRESAELNRRLATEGRRRTMVKTLARIPAEHEAHIRELAAVHSRAHIERALGLTSYVLDRILRGAPVSERVRKDVAVAIQQPVEAEAVRLVRVQTATVARVTAVVHRCGHSRKRAAAELHIGAEQLDLILSGRSVTAAMARRLEFTLDELDRRAA